jgi:hypothetical protein
MPSLNKAKTETKLAFKWGGITLGIILVIFTIFRGIEIIKTLTAPPSPPEAGFGKLPEIPFPKQEKLNFSYNLDTVSGYLPTLSDREKVYKVIANPPTLLSLKKIREKVEKLGFSSSEIKISDDTYRWINLKDPYENTITANIYSSDFTMVTSFLSKTDTLMTYSNEYEKGRPIEEVKNLLEKLSISTGDIDFDKTKTTMYTIDNGSLSQTSKLQNTKILRVDLFQKDVNKLPVVYEKGVSSTMNFLVGKIERGFNIMGASFYHKIASETNSAYAIKTAQEAYRELEQGNAYFVTEPTETDTVTIKNVYLAYYVGENYQEYMMPVVVFEGKNFIAYVCAIKDEWISK